jgi:ABC-type glycerol-3-phosphate transport system substrate-binding protein
MKKIVLLTAFFTALSFALFACGNKPKNTTEPTEEAATTEITGENNSSTATDAMTSTVSQEPSSSTK